MICCTTCEQPKTGNFLRFIVDVQLHPNPGSMEDFLAKIAELRSLNNHQHQLAPEP